MSTWTRNGSADRLAQRLHMRRAHARSAILTHGTMLARRSTLILAAAAFACSAPSDSAASSDDEAARAAGPGDSAALAALRDTLMQRIAIAYDFTRPDAAERMSSLYPDSGRIIAASGGHLTTTVDSLRAGIEYFWTNVGLNMTDPEWHWSEAHVDRLSPDAAVLTGTWFIPHIAPTGDPHTIRGAWTAVFRRIDGEWIIIQEHLSVPPEGQ